MMIHGISPKTGLFTIEFMVYRSINEGFEEPIG
jgi:hypothetical protein